MVDLKIHFDRLHSGIVLENELRLYLQRLSVKTHPARIVAELPAEWKNMMAEGCNHPPSEIPKRFIIGGEIDDAFQNQFRQGLLRWHQYFHAPIRELLPRPSISIWLTDFHTQQRRLITIRDGVADIGTETDSPGEDPPSAGTFAHIGGQVLGLFPRDGAHWLLVDGRLAIVKERPVLEYSQAGDFSELRVFDAVSQQLIAHLFTLEPGWENSGKTGFLQWVRESLAKPVIA